MRADGNQGESGTLDQVHCGDCAKQTSHYHELALALSALLAISLAHVGSTHLPWKATHWKVMERHLRRLSSQEYLLGGSTIHFRSCQEPDRCEKLHTRRKTQVRLVWYSHSIISAVLAC